MINQHVSLFHLWNLKGNAFSRGGWENWHKNETTENQVKTSILSYLTLMSKVLRWLTYPFELDLWTVGKFR